MAPSVDDATSVQTRSNRDFSFDIFSPEVRNEIYRYAYSRAGTFKVAVRGDGRWTLTVAYRVGGKTALLVSKQYLHEAFPVYIRCNRFRIQGVFALRTFKSNPIVRANIRSLTFLYHTQDGALFAELLNSLPKLQTVTIYLSLCLEFLTLPDPSFPVSVTSRFDIETDSVAYREMEKLRKLKSFDVWPGYIGRPLVDSNGAFAKLQELVKLPLVTNGTEETR